VRFLGSRADVPDILRASDVFVLSSDYEGNPLSVLEAMAAGLPVISTAVGGVPELVQHGATGTARACWRRPRARGSDVQLGRDTAHAPRWAMLHGKPRWNGSMCA
jgi:glycosyltransferase involved in cell wall biosynthesis